MNANKANATEASVNESIEPLLLLNANESPEPLLLLNANELLLNANEIPLNEPKGNEPLVNMGEPLANILLDLAASPTDIELGILKTFDLALPFAIRCYTQDQIRSTTALVVKMRYVNHRLQLLLRHPFDFQHPVKAPKYITDYMYREMFQKDFQDFLICSEWKGQAIEETEWIPFTEICPFISCISITAQGYNAWVRSFRGNNFEHSLVGLMDDYKIHDFPVPMTPKQEMKYYGAIQQESPSLLPMKNLSITAESPGTKRKTRSQNIMDLLMPGKDKGQEKPVRKSRKSKTLLSMSPNRDNQGQGETQDTRRKEFLNFMSQFKADMQQISKQIK